MSTTTKLVLLVLVVLGLLAFMALGAGAYQSHRDKERSSDNYEPKRGIKRLGHATDWMLARFDRKWMSGCNAPSDRLLVPPGSSCRVTVAARSRWPSRFTLQSFGGVTLCFALSEAKLTECMVGGKDEELKKADFTVARDSAYLFLRCGLQQSCMVEVSTD